MKRNTILLIFQFCTLVSFSQVEYPFNPIKSNDYFNAYIALDSAQESYVGSKYENEYWQAKGTLYAFLGQYASADYCFYYRDSIMGKLPEEKKELEVDEKLLLSDLDSLCEGYNVVMFNEAHYKSSHRAFLYNQLSSFYEMGFRYLALEALNNYKWRDSLLSERGYPLYTKTGIYINDPVYAHVIRKATELGFELIAYDFYGSEREKNQALNILNEYDVEKGKLLVHGGYAHICESADMEMMGSYLMNQINEDILTFSQHISINYSIDKLRTEEVQLVQSNNDCYDYFVIPIVKSQSNNIPEWMGMMNFENRLLSNFIQSELTIPSLIQVFYAQEENGVPVYQYLLEKDEKDVSLMFPKKGEYSMVIVNNNGSDTVQIHCD